jgi:P2 family phage contractile tail tube protein
MGFPSKLKDMAMFNAGNVWKGEAKSVTLPKLTRKLEGYRGGGMDRPVKVDLGGGDDLDLEATFGGPMRDILRQYGQPGFAGEAIRFSGAYQNDETRTYSTVDVTIRGRIEEIDQGDQKLGEDGEFKAKWACVYYRLDWDGRTEIEIDILNGVEIVNGVDVLADRRAALGI